MVEVLRKTKSQKRLKRNDIRRDMLNHVHFAAVYEREDLINKEQ